MDAEIDRLKQEVARLRGTLSYIAAQAEQNYPGVISVIRVNAKAALNDEWQAAVSAAKRHLVTPNPQKAEEA